MDDLLGVLFECRKYYPFWIFMENILQDSPPWHHEMNKYGIFASLQQEIIRTFAYLTAWYNYGTYTQ